jgi:hypothetical protein
MVMMSAISFAMTKVLLGVAAWDEPMHSINAVVILRRIFLILFTATSIGACIDHLFFIFAARKARKAAEYYHKLGGGGRILGCLKARQSAARLFAGFPFRRQTPASIAPCLKPHRWSPGSALLSELPQKSAHGDDNTYTGRS